MPKRKRVDVEGVVPSFALPECLEDYPAGKAYRLLEPGPVVLVSTFDTSGENSKPNLMTMGFHMVIQHDNPPLIGVIIGPWDHSYKALKRTKECVIAIPTVELAEKAVDIGNCSGQGVDKYEKFGLTPLQASEVGAPLVKECMANLECTVEDTKLVSKYRMWVLRVVKGWVNPEKRDGKIFHHNGQGTFSIQGDLIDLREKMVLWKDYQD